MAEVEALELIELRSSTPIVPEALLFDLGGVVIDIDFRLSVKEWSKYSKLQIEELESVFGFDTAYERHERGEITADEYFAHLRRTLSLDATDSEIRHGWNLSLIGEIDETLQLIGKISPEVPCYAL